MVAQQHHPMSNLALLSRCWRREKGSEDVGVTSKDILQECVEKITKPTG